MAREVQIDLEPQSISVEKRSSLPNYPVLDSNRLTELPDLIHKVRAFPCPSFP
jgi:hypothetical protein